MRASTNFAVSLFDVSKSSFEKRRTYVGQIFGSFEVEETFCEVNLGRRGALQVIFLKGKIDPKQSPLAAYLAERISWPLH